MRTLLAGALAAAVATAGLAVGLAVGPAAPAAASSAAGDDRRIVHYTVRPGDTPSALAVRFHAWTDELIARNGPVLRVGERIEIPVVVSAVPPESTSTSTSKSTSKKKQRASARGLPDPSRDRVRRAIAHRAKRAGVDPNLALAVAWQESGWQMNVISSAGAIGTMQVLPTTGEWMRAYAGHGLALRRLKGNTIAGTTLLRVLRENTRTTRHQVAAYYQGLGAVQRHGLYDETVPYVRNVLAIQRRLDRGLPPR